MEDILGIKKPELEESPGQEATPVVAPVVAPVAAPSPPVQQKETPADQSAGEAFRNTYRQSGSFFDALNQTFKTREAMDEKQVNAKKNLAGLADFAASLGDIFSSSIGGNVEQRKSSAVSDFDNKLVNYRRQLEERNKQYDMLGYRAKMMDMQERMRRGERMEDILHRDKREKKEDDRYLDGKNWRESQAEENSRRWDKSTHLYTLLYQRLCIMTGWTLLCQSAFSRLVLLNPHQPLLESFSYCLNMYRNKNRACQFPSMSY